MYVTINRMWCNYCTINKSNALVLIENAVCMIIIIILLLIEYTALLLECSVTIYRMCYY